MASGLQQIGYAAPGHRPWYELRRSPDGWYLVEVATGEIVDWFGDEGLARQTLAEQNEPLP